MYPLKVDKCLLNFLGKPLIIHQVEMAMKAGIKDYVLIGNPLNIGALKIACDQISTKIQYAIQETPNGMAGALLAAEDMINNEEIIIVNPNDLFDQVVYTQILEERRKVNCHSYIAARKVESYFPGGYLIVNDNLELLGIQEKPEIGKEPSNLVNIVVHLHTEPKLLLSQIKKTKSLQDDVYEQAITMIAKEAGRVRVVPYEGRWIAIKYPWHILDAIEFFLGAAKKGRISRTAKIFEGATVENKVIIDENAKVMKGAIIKGPCYIGKNTIVGNYALIRDFSHIGNNCTIGYSTEVKHSYIGDNCLFHSNYIGDSIIEGNCLFGDGSITANLRFDKKNIKISVNAIEVDTGKNKLGSIMGENSSVGVGCMIMPGVRIGHGSTIGPGIVLHKDTEPYSSVILKQEHVIKRAKPLSQ